MKTIGGDILKLRLFHDENIEEEHMDIHYRCMKPIIEDVIDIVENKKGDISLYGINKREEKILIDTKDIYYFEYVDKRNFAYMKEEVYQVHESLASLETNLRSEGFIRVNKSNIVNIKHIASIKSEANMRVRAIMENGEYLIINRSYKSGFKKFLKERRNIL